MEEQTCEVCGHYIRHYVRIGNKYHGIALGHCVYPRVKSKDKDAKACEHYTEKTNKK